MANVIMSSSGRRLSSGNRGKPRMVLRGLRRRKVKKLRDTILVVMHEDSKEERRAEAQGYDPYLLKGETGGTWDKAMRSVLARCNNALAEKA